MEQSRGGGGGWLAGNIACSTAGTSQAVESQSLIELAFVLAVLDLHSEARGCLAEGRNPFPQWWLSQRSFHRKQRGTVKIAAKCDSSEGY